MTSRNDFAPRPDRGAKPPAGPGRRVRWCGLRPHGEDGFGARAVRIVHGFRRGARKIEHLGSTHDEKALEALKATARQRLANLIRVGSGLQAD